MKVVAKQSVHDHIVDDCDHQNLSAGRIYTVFEINDDSFRVVNDCGEPILYPKKLFDVIDCGIPSGWIFREIGDGEYHIGPAGFLDRGFYEDYFDKEPIAIAKFDSLKKMSEAW